MAGIEPQDSDSSCQISSLYLIKASGIIQFNWYANEELREKWKEDEILFSGFLIALNAIGQIFFEGKPMKSIIFDGNTIVFRMINHNNDLLCIVCDSDCPEDVLNSFIFDITKIISTYPNDISFVNFNWNEKFSFELNELIASYKDKLGRSQESVSSTYKTEIFSNKDQKTSSQSKSTILNRPLDQNKILDLGKGLGNAFNNVLSIILGNINLAKMDAEPNSEQMECLNDAETSLSRAKVLSSLLLSISNKISSLKSQLDENSH